MSRKADTKTPLIVIEDETDIRTFLNATLSAQGYRPQFADTGRDGLKLVARNPQDIIILDLGLPDMDGLEAIREIRLTNRSPIIVLSARVQETDKISALEAGADDYMTKPFSAGELLARVKVAQRHAAQLTEQASTTVHSGDLSINLERREVQLCGVKVILTPTEYRLLNLLVLNEGRLVTHQQLLEGVWGTRARDQGHYLRIYIQRLRQKLNDDPLNPKYILTDPGVGYSFQNS